MCKLPSNNPNYQTTQPRLPAEHSQTAKLIAMPRKNEPLKVGISIFLPSATLDQIDQNIEGKSRSEKIRNLIELGLQATHRNNKGIRSEVTRSLSQPP
jgi:hypothetical protein